MSKRAKKDLRKARKDAKKKKERKERETERARLLSEQALQEEEATKNKGKEPEVTAREDSGEETDGTALVLRAGRFTNVGHMPGMKARVQEKKPEHDHKFPNVFAEASIVLSREDSEMHTKIVMKVRGLHEEMLKVDRWVLGVVQAREGRGRGARDLPP